VITNNEALIQTLDAGRVEFILIGGVAAILHGSARLTLDLDVAYARNRDNIERLVEALAVHHPYPRGAPDGLPFKWDAETVRRGLNFTLKTDLGDFDLLGEAAGGGTYEMLLPHTIEMNAYGLSFRCVTIDMLIHLKRAAGRPKDFEAIAELEALREEIKRRDG
jgi:hypothetical protein